MKKLLLKKVLEAINREGYSNYMWDVFTDSSTTRLFGMDCPVSMNLFGFFIYVYVKDVEVDRTELPLRQAYLSFKANPQKDENIYIFKFDEEGD